MSLEQTFDEFGLKWLSFNDDAKILGGSQSILALSKTKALQDILSSNETSKLLIADNGDFLPLKIESKELWALVIRKPNHTSGFIVISPNQPSSSDSAKSFIKKVSHDIKNPLGAANANVEFLISLLDEEGALPKTQDVAKRAAEAISASISVIREAEGLILNNSGSNKIKKVDR